MAVILGIFMKQTANSGSGWQTPVCRCMRTWAVMRVSRASKVVRGACALQIAPQATVWGRWPARPGGQCCGPAWTACRRAAAQPGAHSRRSPVSSARSRAGRARWMHKTQRVAGLAVRQWQCAGGVVLEVDEAHHTPSGQRTRLRAKAWLRLVPVLCTCCRASRPWRHNASTAAGPRGMADAARRPARERVRRAAQVAQQQAVLLPGQQHGHPQAPRRQVVQAPGFGGNGRCAAQVGDGAQHLQARQSGQCAQHAVAPMPWRGPAFFSQTCSPSSM